MYYTENMRKGFSGILVLIVVVVLVVGAGAYYLGTQKSSVMPYAQTPSLSASPSPTSDGTAGLKTYTNQGLGFSIKYLLGMEVSVDNECVTFGVPETDNAFSVCRSMLNGRSLEQWLKGETVAPNTPNCQGLYGTCGESALNYEDLKLTNITVNNYKAVKVEQTESSLKTKYNGMRGPKIYIFTANQSMMYEIGGNYDDKILSTFKFIE